MYILLTYFTVLFVATNLPEVRLRRIITCALIGFGIVALIGVLQYINIIHIKWEQLHWEKGFGKRVFSTFGNPNALGSFLILFLPMSMLFGLSETNKLLRIVFLMIFLIGFACLLFTNSWGCWFGFIGAIIISIIFCIKGKIKIWKQGLIIMLAGIILIGSAFILNKKGKIFGEPTGAIARGLLWETAAYMIKDRPITGFGPNGFIYYSNNNYLNVLETNPKYDKLWLSNPNFILRNPGYPENEYLNILVDTGIIGGGLLLWLIIGFFRSSRRKFTNSKGNEKALVLGITAGIIAILINSIIDIPFSEWYIVGALFFALVGIGSEKREVKIPVHLFAICVCIISLVFFSKAVRTAISEGYFTKADIASAKKDSKSAIELYKKSAKFSILTHMVFSNMGKLAYDNGQNEDAAKYYRESIKLLPFHESLHYCLGSVYHRMGDFARAESSLSYALKLEPRYSVLMQGSLQCIEMRNFMIRNPNCL